MIMKTKIQVFILLFLMPLMALAEYNGYHVEFKIEFNNGTEIHGYNYLTNVYIKGGSTDLAGYLENHHDVSLANGSVVNTQGNYGYYEHRLAYTYEIFEGRPAVIYSVLNRKLIALNDVKSLKVIDIKNQTYAVNVSSVHRWDDQLWMDTKPIGHFTFSGLFCSDDIYIHEKSEATDVIIKELKELSKSMGRTLNQYIEEGRPEAEIEKLEEKVNARINKILQPFNEDNSLKVVIITECSC